MFNCHVGGSQAAATAGWEGVKLGGTLTRHGSTIREHVHLRPPPHASSCARAPTACLPACLPALLTLPSPHSRTTELLAEDLLSPAADTWSFGTLLWELLNGRRAWRGMG